MTTSLTPQMRECISAAVKAHGSTRIIDADRLSRNLIEAVPVMAWRCPLSEARNEIIALAVAQRRPLKFG